MNKHWQLKTDDDNILWILFDKKDAKINSINREVMEELSDIIYSTQQNTAIKGIIITSAKPGGFIAGADINQFNDFEDEKDAENILLDGQALFKKIQHSKIPFVAMIEGFCLGGGLELALACRYRVAEDNPKTRLGLPEVKLGIHPGWGGTIRLPHLIGPIQGLKLILTGSTVNAKTAEKLGIVDAAVPKRQLVRAAKYYALHHPKSHNPSYLQNLLNKKFLRTPLAFIMRKQLAVKANPAHYPAPFHVLNNWEEYGVQGEEAMKKEAETCGKLFFSDTSKNLVRVFFLQERLKSLGKKINLTVKKAHVIGAGTMGGDIAAWCALQGLQVTLQDREPKLIAPAIKRAYQLFKEKLKDTHLVQKAMDRLTPDVEGKGVKDADVIIEAVFENLAVKQDIFKQVEEQAKPDAILATNTSSIPLDEINTVMKNPERLVGIHFFNPVPKMLLVEVVKGNITDTTIVDKAIALTHQLDRLPVPVISTPGFLINRILMPYLLESFIILSEGVPAEIIDKAMLEFGMPMGPVTLADTVGLDVCLSVMQFLGKYTEYPIPEKLTAMVQEGKLGRKTGEGFYRYQSGKRIKSKAPDYDKPLTVISDRLVAKIIKESRDCLNDNVVTDADLLDAAMIFGTGFAPFRGGPIHYADKKSSG